MTCDESRATSPNIPLLLGALEAHSISYVLIGSVAAQAYGVDVQPGDLDIAPALDADNLAFALGLGEEMVDEKKARLRRQKEMEWDNDQLDDDDQP